MALPGIVYLLINNYMPMAGLVVAFKKFSAKKGIWHSDWIGFENFRYLFQTSDAWVITRNTILYNVTFILLGTLLAVLIAILLNEVRNESARKIYQSTILLPNLVSWVIISYLAFAFLSSDNGFINNTIFPLFSLEPISWYNSPQYWPFILVFVSLWQSAGYFSVVYYATVIGIDKGYYEAAELEGAGPWTRVWHITLPLLRPMIITMVMLQVGRIFYSDFGLFYQIPMNSGALFSTTNVIETYVYRGLIEQGNIGMSAAAGLYQSVVGFIVVILANHGARKLEKENAFI